MTDPRPPAVWSVTACRWLAGADAGVGGALVALLWLAVHSRLAGQYWWAKFNIAAAPFYGDRVFSAGFGMATFTGLACLLLGLVFTGALIGRLTPEPPSWPRSLSMSMLVSLLLYLVSHRWLWPAVHPFARAWFSPLATLPAHVLFALMMVRLGRRYLALRIAFTGLDWPPPPPPPPPVPPAEDVLEPGVHVEESAAFAPPSEEPPPDPPPSAAGPIVEQVSDPLK